MQRVTTSARNDAGRLLTTIEAAAFFAVHRNTFAAEIAPHLPALVIGRRRRYRLRDLEKYAANNLSIEP